MFKALDERQRLEFLQEIWTSLPGKAREEFLQSIQAKLTDGLPIDENGTESLRPEADPSAGVAILTDGDLRSSEKIDAAGAKSEQDQVLSQTEVANPGSVKGGSVEAAMSQFEKLQQEHMHEQKKSFRKEFFSCLGLGLVGLLILVLISMGLRWVWDTFVS